MKIFFSLFDKTCLINAHPEPINARTVKSNAPFSLKLKVKINKIEKNLQIHQFFKSSNWRRVFQYLQYFDLNTILKYDIFEKLINVFIRVKMCRLDSDYQNNIIEKSLKTQILN